MLHILQKIKGFISVIRNSKYLGLIAVLLLVAVIPLTVIVSQMNQDTRQRAAEKKFALKIPDRFKGQFKNPEYVQGEIVVKLKFPVGKIKPKSEKMTEGLDIDKKAIAFSDLDSQTLPTSLTSINQQYKIKQIEKVFKGAENPQKQLTKIKQSFSQDITSGKRKINEKELSKIDLSKTFKISLEDNSQLEQAINDLNNRLDIEYAEYNYIYKTSYLMDDPYYLDSYPSNVSGRDTTWNPSFDYQCNLKKINTEQSWTSIASNSSIIAAVIDTGIDYTHPDLGGCSLEQVNNNQCPKIVPGYNFVNSTNDPMDDHGHGTHVAGTIASITNNNTGIAGMNPPDSQIKIMPMKGLDNQGNGTLTNLSAAIVQAAQNGAKVINMSYGNRNAYQPESPVEQDALAQAFNLGVVLVAAAGNSNQNVSDGFWPANNSYVIAVSASDTQDQKASFSNYGPKISVAAPGVDILSLRAKNTDMYCPDSCNTHIVGQQYYRSNGTSMASPHVAGFSALLLSKDPTYSNLDVKTLIEKYATDIGVPGFDQNFGYGRINVQASLTGTLPAIGEIYDPNNNGYIGKNFQVIGTVGGKTFSSYKLELGQGVNPATWSTDGITLVSGGTIPIANDLIGTVLLSSSQAGNFVLRLSVTSNTGEITERKVSIILDTDLKTGWPKTMDYKGSSPLDQSYFIASDLNGDGKKELAASSYSGNVYLWDNNGQSLTGWPKYLGGDLGGRADNVLAVSDFNSDGKKELVIRSYKAQCDPGKLIGDTCYGYTLSTELHLLNANGLEINSSWPKVGPVYSYSNPVISNIDLENKPKIVVFNAVDNKLHVFDYQGNDDAIDLSLGGSNYMSIGDINGDGKKEIIFAKDSSIIAYQYNNTNIATLLWSKSIDSPSFAKPTLADVDRDGKLEIIASSGSSFDYCKVWVFKSDGNNQSGWPQNDFTNQGNCGRSPAAVGDINNDGILDLVLGTSQGRIMVYAADGTIENIFYGNSFYDDLNKGVALADINGDGYSEVVVGSSGDQDFFAWDYNGNFLPNWPKHVLTYSTPQIVDMDSDGKVNIVALGKDNYTSNYKIFVWKFNSTLSNSYLDYPLYGFNEQRTSNWVPARVVNTPTPTIYLSPTPPPPTPTPIPVPNAPVILNPGKAVNFGDRDVGGVYGKGNYLLFENSKLNPGNEFSIELWVKPEKMIEKVNENPYYYSNILLYSPKDSYSFLKRAYQLLIGKGIGNSYGISFIVQESYNLGSGSFNSVSFQLPNNWITTSAWMHVGVTMKDKQLKLYINGQLIAQKTIQGIYIADNSILTLGGIVKQFNMEDYLDAESQFYGSIDDVRISNVARDITGNWSSGAYFGPLAADTNTMALWNFQNNFQDISSNGINGASYGITTYVDGIQSLTAPIFAPTPTPTPGPTATPTPIPLPSNPGKAVNFKYKGITQYTSDYVVIADNNGSLAVGNDMTIETWIRLDQSIESVSIVNKHYKDKSNYVYSLGTQNYDFITDGSKPNRSKPMFLIKTNGGQLTLISDDVIHDDGSEWTHLAVIKKGTEVKLFVNGILKKSGTLAGQVADQQTALMSLAAFLYNGTIHNSLFGAIDDLRISNNARNIEDNWKNGVYFQPLQVDINTLALWRFENNLQDNSQNHLDGTSFGNISYENGRVSLPPTPTPTPTPIPQIKVSFKNSSGSPISQKFCAVCFNSGGGYVKSYACYSGSDVAIPKPAVCSGNTYNPTIGIDTKRSDIVNGIIVGVTANPTSGFRSLHNNSLLGWIDWNRWTTGDRTLNIIVSPRPTPTPYRRITPTVAPFVCTCRAADINKDNSVDSLDYAIFASCYMKRATDKTRSGLSCFSSDINANGVVNGQDYTCFSSQYRNKCQ